VQVLTVITSAVIAVMPYFKDGSMSSHNQLGNTLLILDQMTI
jgi:hypothetical protein